MKLNKGIDLNRNTVYKILTWLQTAIAHYIKDSYRLYKLGKEGVGYLISIDESIYRILMGKKSG